MSVANIMGIRYCSHQEAQFFPCHFASMELLEVKLYGITEISEKPISLKIYSFLCSNSNPRPTLKAAARVLLLKNLCVWIESSYFSFQVQGAS